MGRRESARFRRRRQAWWEVQSGATARQALDAATQQELVAAIDKKRSQAFGIERLARLQLDGGAPAPAWVSRTNDDGTLSLLRYASLRGRERIVGMLLRGGAALACWPCDGENFPRLVSPWAATGTFKTFSVRFPGSSRRQLVL